LAEWLTVSVASRKAGVSDRTIRNWITKGNIQAKKEGGKWLIDPSSLSEIGNDYFQQVGKSEKVIGSETLISVPLERYEGLITRLTQLESENMQYRKMLESAEMKRKKRSWWSRLRHRDKGEAGKNTIG